MEYVFTPLKSEGLSERKFEHVMWVFLTGSRVKSNGLKTVGSSPRMESPSART